MTEAWGLEEGSMTDEVDSGAFRDMSHDELLSYPTIYRDGLLEGQVVLVSGGGTGIGIAIAGLCARLGAKVVVCSRKEENLQNASRLLDQIGNPYLTHAMTIRDPEEVAALMDNVWETFGQLDLLVNNAGGQFPQEAIDLTPNGWHAVTDLNLTGTFFMMQAAARHWRDRKQTGSVVNITAPVRRGIPQIAHSSAARAGVSNLAQTLAVEWAPLNVRVNCVAPGPIESSGLNVYPEEARSSLMRRNTMRRLGTVMEVAEAVVYIGGPSGSYITGETLAVDGGQFMWGQMWMVNEPDYYSEQ